MACARHQCGGHSRSIGGAAARCDLGGSQLLVTTGKWAPALFRYAQRSEETSWWQPVSAVPNKVGARTGISARPR
eukprot:2698083-Amphidinium_carterae.1